MVIDMRIGDLDGQLAATGHRITGVDREVQQRIFHLIKVDLNRPGARGLNRLNLDPLAQCAAQQLRHAAHQPIGVHTLGRQWLAAGKGEQPLRQHGCTFGARHRIVRRTAHPLIIIEAALEQFKIARHHLQQIVEVMGHATGQLAERLHLLRLPQRGLRIGKRAGMGALFGNIPRHAIDQPIVGHRCPAEVTIIAVLCSEPVFKAPRGNALLERINLVPDMRDIIGMLHPFRRAADQLLLAPSQYVRPCRAGRQPCAVHVGYQKRVAGQRP